jgi:hypothetical protein
MSASKQPVNRRSLQHLLLRRFAMAVATYGIVMTLFWLAVIFDLLPAPQSVALVSSVLVVLSQLLFFALLRSDYNLRFRDPSMTEAQVLVGCSWLTYLLALLDSGRGTLLMFMCDPVVRRVQLPPRVFARCAACLLQFSRLNLGSLSRSCKIPWCAAGGSAVLRTLLAVPVRQLPAGPEPAHAQAPLRPAGASGHPARDDAPAGKPGRHR